MGVLAYSLILQEKIVRLLKGFVNYQIDKELFLQLT
ncbi:Uncharacterised protein [Bacteroides ovatus]|nr:Uncharacterised protein [Bacteroides ovatus]